MIRVGAESFSSRLAADAKRFSWSTPRSATVSTGFWAGSPGRCCRSPSSLPTVRCSPGAAGRRPSRAAHWTSALVGVIASVIAMVPLGLVLLSSVAFAVGGVRLAGNKVLIQELAAVEGLARVDVLCLDKTGTLTEGQIIFDGVHELAEPAEPGWEHALGWFAADPEANATSRCLEADFEHDGGTPAVSSVPFSSARKWSSVTFDGGGPRQGSWILGAPEVVLGGQTWRRRTRVRRRAPPWTGPAGSPHPGCGPSCSPTPTAPPSPSTTRRCRQL